MLNPLEQFIAIDRQKFKLRFFLRPPEGSNKFVLDRTYTIAVGMKGYESPRNLYEVIRKGRNVDWYMPYSSWVPEDQRGIIIPGKDPRNPIKARWIEIYDGAGIHGTDAVESLGTRASHGCFRMSVPDVIELFDKVKKGCPVFIY
jgi:lipoprotein-anchoring transpeptidase ErfK/SrfK